MSSLTPKQYHELRELLSYRITGSEAFYAGRRSPVRYLISKKGEFMTGLLPRVEDYCSRNNIPLLEKDTRVKPIPKLGTFTLQGFEPRDFQLKAVEALAKRGRAGAEMVTASGKSLTMALLIHKLQLRTLVVVPTVGLKEQLRSTFARVFGTLDHVQVENIDSPALREAKGYDCLILDETHHAAAKTYRKLNLGPWKDIYRRYFFSGTYFRGQEEESMLLEGIAGTPCFRFTYRDAVEAGAVVPVEAYYYALPKKEVQGNESNYASVYSELIVDNEYRNLLIGSILGRLHTADKRTLCLVKEIKHGERLSNLTYFPFANGKDGQSQELITAFNRGELKTLIATTGVCGEGIDTVPAEYIIMAAGGKSKIQFMQHVGRGLRRFEGKESAKIILFKDPSHKYMIKHFNSHLKYLSEDYGIKATLLPTD